MLDLFENKCNFKLIFLETINHVDKLASQTALFYASRKGHT